MLPDKIALDVLTPGRRVLSVEVEEVVLPGACGSFGVRPGHHPMIAELAAGPLRVRMGKRSEQMALGGGFTEILRDRVSVLASSCERGADIDVVRAQRALERARQRLRSRDPNLDRERAEQALERARARLLVAKRSAEG